MDGGQAQGGLEGQDMPPPRVQGGGGGRGRRKEDAQGPPHTEEHEGRLPRRVQEGDNVGAQEDGGTGELAPREDEGHMGRLSW